MVLLFTPTKKEIFYIFIKHKFHMMSIYLNIKKPYDYCNIVKGYEEDQLDLVTALVCPLLEQGEKDGGSEGEFEFLPVPSFASLVTLEFPSIRQYNWFLLM